MINIRRLESDLWESADLLRAESKLTSNQYCMPVLGLIFLRYAYSRYKMVEEELMKSRPMRNGRILPIESTDFREKSAIYLPEQARYSYLVNLPDDVKASGLKNVDGQPMNSLGEVVNNAMLLIEKETETLKGVLPKNYTIFSDSLLQSLIRIFNRSEIDEIGGDIIGRIYEYFLNKFAKNVAQDDGVFFTPKSLVKMIVNVLEPKSGVLLDPACGSGGMFVQTGDFVNASGMAANKAMTFYGQEKVEYNAQLCLMNIAVHGLSGNIKSGDEANSFYHDAHNLNGRCDYVMANPPFNVDKVNAEKASNAGRLPFGLPGVNKKTGEIGNANYLWISYFYSFLNEQGRAGFVMASSATDSQNRDKTIREELVKTGDVDVMVSVGNNFFYTKSLPCSLWFFDRAKKAQLKDSILFIDAKNYYTVVDRTLNEWSEWQLKNLNAIVWLYRGEIDRYKALVSEYYVEAMTWFGKLDMDIRLDNDEQSLQNYLKAIETVIGHYEADIKELQAKVKTIKGRDDKNKCKARIAQLEESLESAREMRTTILEAIWLTDKFGDGEYHDINGLCKIATIADVEEKGWSLTPGAYVGVADTGDDGVDFHQRMKEIHSELTTLQAESNRLMEVITKNMEEMGL